MSGRINFIEKCFGEADPNIRKMLIDSPNSSRTRGLLLNVIKNELTPRQKEIIMLYYFKKLNTIQIAEQFGVTPQAVSAVMARARKRIYRIMKYYIR